MIQSTSHAMKAKPETYGINQQTHRMAMAIPMDRPQSPSTGSRRQAYSLAREPLTAETTKNCQMMLKKGMSCSHTKPGDMLRL